MTNSLPICVDSETTGAITMTQNQVPKTHANTQDVRMLLKAVANANPHLEKAMDVTERLIVHLETMRHEALFSMSFKNHERAEKLMRQKAAVKINSSGTL